MQIITLIIATLLSFQLILVNSTDGIPLATNTNPQIISRQTWKAKDPIGKGKEHQISFITIHHTASSQNKKTSIEKKMQNLQNFSQSESKLASGKLKPVWFDIPYHYYISYNGKIAEGREINFAGDTNTEYDPTGHALIVLEGNFETEQPTAEQQKSLQEMMIWLADKYKVPVNKIKAHNDFAKTACPGNNLKIILPSLIDTVGNDKKQSKRNTSKKTQYSE